MSDREKLIEEAAEAIAREWRNVRSHEDMARAAFAVFEKAHTPTDDEREALVAILEAPLTEESHGRTFSEMLADVILIRFGFRRSEVPEPSAEGYAEFEGWESRCDYCGSALPGVKHLAHVPTTPDMQRMGFVRIWRKCARWFCYDCIAPELTESLALTGGAFVVPGCGPASTRSHPSAE